MTRPNLGLIKPITDIKADLVLDIDEGRSTRDAIRDASAALRGSFGYNANECRFRIYIWIAEQVEEENTIYAKRA